MSEKLSSSLSSLSRERTATNEGHGIGILARILNQLL